MTFVPALAEWFNIRPHELRPLGLAVACAFLILSFVVLSRSLREAFFLTAFDIRQLPWMIAAVVVGSLPAVSQFSRLLGRSDPRRVIRILVAAVAVGILPLGGWLPGSRTAVVVFYLWTAVGTLLVTSGFWVVVSDQFPLRGAKRLFGLIGAGGTAGAMVTGLSLSWVTGHVSLVGLVFVSAGLLGTFVAVLSLLPKVEPAQTAPAHSEESGADPSGHALPLVQSIRLIWSRSHLRSIAFVVFCATMITTLVDFQFKDLARAQFDRSDDLVAYFGGLYGWAGFAALVLQVFVAGRLLERARIGVVLGISPVLMMIGSVGILLGPGLVLATAVRGVDYSLRKALYRPTIEVLFVPVAPWLRRRTKTLIDSLVDASAEGCGALIILLWVAAAGMSSRYLAVLVVAAALVLLVLGRRLDRQYFLTVVSRMQEEEKRSQAAAPSPLLPARDLLSATFTNLDLSALRNDGEAAAEIPARAAGASGSSDDLLAELQSADDAVVLRAVNRILKWNPAHLGALARLIARDSLFRRVIRLLQRFPEDSVPPAVRALGDDDTDFVIRRRIPDLLAKVGGEEADEALVEALTNNRFEVRYRAALALVSRRKRGLPEARRNWGLAVWHAIRVEVRRERALWELQILLDKHPDEVDDLVTMRLGARGELSLEHTFRLLTLVLDPERVRAAYHGVILDDPQLKSLALEYLEQVLPSSVRHRLWVFIGDISEKRREQQLRPLDAVVADMMATDLTLFRGDASRLALQRMIDERDDRSAPGES